MYEKLRYSSKPCISNLNLSIWDKICSVVKSSQDLYSNKGEDIVLKYYFVKSESQPFKQCLS